MGSLTRYNERIGTIACTCFSGQQLNAPKGCSTDVHTYRGEITAPTTVEQESVFVGGGGVGCVVGVGFVLVVLVVLVLCWWCWWCWFCVGGVGGVVCVTCIVIAYHTVHQYTAQQHYCKQSESCHARVRTWARKHLPPV